MGIIKRINDLLKANINHLISTVEDPEKMLNQLMGNLREEKQKARVQVARCLTDEKRLEQQVREHQEKLTQWQKRAEVAVMRDEDELAREAIARRNEFATMVDELTRQWEEQHQMAEQLKDALVQLDRRYKEADFKKQALIHQYRANEAQQKATATMAKLTNMNHLDEFSRVEEKIKEAGAMASANRELESFSLDDRFRQLESEGVVEHDLVQLKLQLGKQVPQLPGGNGTGSSSPALPDGSTSSHANGNRAHTPGLPAATHVEEDEESETFS